MDSAAVRFFIGEKDDFTVEDVTDTSAAGFDKSQKAWGDIGVDDLVMIKSHPCKAVSITQGKKKGKSGCPRMKVVGLDIYTGSKYEDMQEVSYYVEVAGDSSRAKLAHEVFSDMTVMEVVAAAELQGVPLDGFRDWLQGTYGVALAEAKGAKRTDLERWILEQPEGKAVLDITG